MVCSGAGRGAAAHRRAECVGDVASAGRRWVRRDRVRRIRTWKWLCGIDEPGHLRWEKSQPVSELLNA